MFYALVHLLSTFNARNQLRLSLLLLSALTINFGCGQSSNLNDQNSPTAFLGRTVHINQTEVENQFDSGFCWSYTFMALLESQAIKKGKKVNLSEEYIGLYSIYAKLKKVVHKDNPLESLEKIDDGQYLSNVLSVIEKYGVIPEYLFPHKFKGQDASTIIKEAFKLNFLDREKIKLYQKDKNILRKDFFSALKMKPFKPNDTFSFAGQKYTPIRFAKEYFGYSKNNYISLASNGSSTDLKIMLHLIKLSLINGHNVPMNIRVFKNGLSDDGIWDASLCEEDNCKLDDTSHIMLIVDYKNKKGHFGAMSPKEIKNNFFEELDSILVKNSYGSERTFTQRGKKATSKSKATGYNIIKRNYMKEAVRKANLSIIIPTSILTNSNFENFPLDSQIDQDYFNDFMFKSSVISRNFEWASHFLSEGAEINFTYKEKLFANPLVLNIMLDNLEGAKYLLENGANPNLIVPANYGGNTAIHYAAHLGENDFIKSLLKFNADPLLKDTYNNTPIMMSHSAGNVSTSILLLKHAGKSKELVDLFEAIKRNNLDQVKDAIKNGASCDAYLGNNTSITYSIKMGQIDIARFLIEKSTLINRRDNSSRSPLHLASLYGDYSLVKLLISKGAKTTMLDAKGFAPIHYAVTYNRARIVEKLLSHDDDLVHLQTGDNINKETPLHLAAQHGHYSIAKQLLNFSKTRIDEINGEKGTPLHVAAWYQHLDIAKLLISRGVNINPLSQTDKTPLHYASIHNQVELAKELVKAGADPSLKSTKGLTALDYARDKYPQQENYKEIVEYLESL